MTPPIIEPELVKRLRGLRAYLWEGQAKITDEAADVITALQDRVRRLEEAQGTAAERVMKALWPLLGGNHTEAELWHEIGDAVTTALNGSPDQ